MLYIPFERRIYRCKNEVIEIERQKGKESENNLIKNVLHTKFLEGNSPKLKGDQSTQSELSS